MPFADNDGIKVHYRIEGEGPPIVLLHGFMDDLEEWNEYGYVDSLKESYKLILIDLRGHGLSDKPHDSDLYTMDSLTSDIIAVMDDLKIKKTLFWGYSMGGHIGFGLNRHHPNRFSSFILGGISPQKVDKELKEKIEGYHELFKDGAQKFLSYLQTRGVEITPEVKEEIEQSDFEALKAFWGADIFYEDDRQMAQLNVPLLLYVGEEDEWGHFLKAREYCESEKNATFVSFPNRGHDIQSSKDLVFPSVNEFLESLK